MAVQPKVAKLKSQLNTSGLSQANPSLYQIIKLIIEYLAQEQQAVNEAIGIPSGSGGGTSLSDKDYLTHTDEVASLPNSRELLAGARISFNDTVANERTVIADAINQLTGDVIAGPGSGSQVASISNLAVTAAKLADDAVTTQKILNANVTYAKIQDVSAASRLLGKGDSGAGDVEEILLGLGLSMSGTTLSADSSDWDVLTDGDIDETELIFASGEVIMLETP